MRARETAFSRWLVDSGDFVEGPLTLFDANLPLSKPLHGEWLAWLFEELIAERDCILILENYFSYNRFVQFCVDEEGSVWAEAVSNEFLPEDDRLTPADESALAAIGWLPPTCGWPVPKSGRFESPNFHRTLEMPASVGVLAVMTVRTLGELFDVRAALDIRFKFFRRGGRDHDDTVPDLSPSSPIGCTLGELLD